MLAFEIRQNESIDSQTAISMLSQNLGVSETLSKLLVNRSITDPKAVKEFLNPSLDYLHDPFLFRDMAKAVERINQAISCGERITVYGDYDVDGITAAAIVYTYLSCLLYTSPSPRDS